MNLVKNKKTRALIIIMSALVCTSITISYFYYKSTNESVDPRIKQARLLYSKYNNYANRNDFDSVFYLMDTIEKIYTTIPHYRNSFEMGVLYNNRCAAYLTMALFEESYVNNVILQDSLISIAQQNAQKSISVYQNWISKYDGLDVIGIKSTIKEQFLIGLEKWGDKKQEAFLENRIDEIEQAQMETKRRLSVSYTNLGIILRHKLQYEQAAETYKKALDLWDRNLTAENNLNKLLGRPVTKRNVIQKLFPPSKDEK